MWEPRKLSSSLAVRIPAPPKRMTSRMRAGVGEGDPFPSQHKQQLSRSNSLLALDLPVDVDDVGHHLLLHQHQSQLSEFIPDIALATAASTNSSVTSQLNLPAHFSASTTLQPPEPYRSVHSHFELVTIQSMRCDVVLFSSSLSSSVFYNSAHSTRLTLE